MMAQFREFSEVRLRATLTQREAYGDEVRTVPAGTAGTIVDVLRRDEAFEVDFQLTPPQFDTQGKLLDAGITHVVTLTAGQIDPI